MQFHHNGYVSGNPKVEPAAGSGIDRPTDLPDKMDVLIVGAGPAGMMTAAQLSQFPEVTTRLIDARPERLAVANADGVQARSVETFQAFDFANEIMNEAYHITEMAVWRPDPDNQANIVRASVPVDDPSGISEFPHLIINQVRVQDHLVEFMANSPTRMAPDYGVEFVDLTVEDEGEYPVRVHLKYTGGPRKGEERTVRTKYVAGCDGAHSPVRKNIGRHLEGKQAAHAWGVLDVLTETDFPDIRTKCIIQSESGGNILHIPREGGYLCRMYVDLGEVNTDEESKRIQKTTFDEIVATANEILHPYTVEVRSCARSTVYEVGHRLTDKFDDVDDPDTQTPRVMIAGDACHTHSAKAGQGMNVSLQDGFNLGWKLGHVAAGTSPATLLNTYSAERQEVAKNLIDFDREFAHLMGTKAEDFDDPAELENFYVKTWEFPAGFMTEYPPSQITGTLDHQALAGGYPMGKRFKSARVVRVCDANYVHLGHLARADGRWRMYVFADETAATSDDSALARWAAWIRDDPKSPVNAHVPAGAGFDSLLDIKLIYQQTHDQVEAMDAPEIFKPRVGPYDLVNHEQVFAVRSDEDIFEVREIDRNGVVVVVRPDQYVAHILPLSATDELAEFFAGFLC